MNNAFNKLKAKLAELFQLDQADLDFGIYRIMNARRDEITGFLENDLLPQVSEAFSQYQSSDKAELQKKLDKVLEGVATAGMSPDDSPKVKELREQLAGGVDISAMETDVYDHLQRFFARYYDEGDFISMRRYKEGVYAIPYEGEEVKLHWANSDQYYVKTSENFRNYTFKTPDESRVHFKLVEADTEKDNIKATNENQRRFILAIDNGQLKIDNGALIIPFEYRTDGEKSKQDALNTKAVETVMAALEADHPDWHKKLSVIWTRSDGTKSEKTLLEKHLNDYTKKNTFDYFIHKDLSKFLRQELDFYIKNEVMRLDDIEHAGVPKVEQYLSKIKVIRRIAHKIIEFLAQLENFQKKLWLKKKFVLETNYCITLDRVPEELYPQITQNKTQIEEWVNLGFIEKENPQISQKDADKNLFGKNLREPVPSADNISVEVLKANDKLVLDTQFFDDQFKAKLLGSIDDFDEQCDGLLIHSENFQALNLLQERYREQVKCVYIDPPYNTGGDGFVYKDSYQHSSWLSMCFDRIACGLELMSNSSIFFASIDESEIANLRLLLTELTGTMGVTGEFVWKKRAGGDMAAGCGIGLAMEHEYVVTAAKTYDAKYRGKRKNDSEFSNPDDDPDGLWITQDLTCNKTSGERPSLFYDLIDPNTGNVFKCSAIRVWSYEKEKMEAMIKRTINGRYLPKVLFPKSPDKKPKLKKFLRERKSDYAPISSWLENHKTDSKNGGIINGFAPLNSVATKEFSKLFGTKPFVYPKSINLIKIFIEQTTTEADISLDYFAGSGTTGHAVINLNREDNGNRKYILVEMGEHFNNVLKPRIAKVVYSQDWKDGKPTARETGVSHCFKYIKLESYEDALSNIQLKRSDQQQVVFNQSDSFRESYMLGYMLDEESKNSPSLLNVVAFDDPFSYQLLVGTGSAGETKPINVDLVETFNYLIGLKVKSIQTISGYRMIEGENLKEQKILIIWRKIRNLSEKNEDTIIAARARSNEELDTFFKKQRYNTLDMKHDLIYVNGDNNLMNIPILPEADALVPRYKVRLIEEEFKKLMFSNNG